MRSDGNEINVPKSQTHSEKIPVLASVIVPSYNSMRTIRRCLHSILAQETSFPFEVICVDSSKDETPDIISREFPQVRLIHIERQTYPGSARNLGIRQAQGSIIACTDSDCIVDKN